MNLPSDPALRKNWYGALRLLPLLVASVSACQPSADWDLVDEYCTECHNSLELAGGIAFDALPRDSLASHADTWELAIRKVRTGMMPPAGEPRPPRAALNEFTHALGASLDAEYLSSPDPGSEGLARLNREEYRNAIRDLLQFDASDIVASLPAESAGEGFDNNIELLSVSPTLIDAYASAAMRISREAVGDLTLIASEVDYGRDSGSNDGLPPGTRGGMAVTHDFPLDARYRFTVGAGGGGGIFGGGGFCSGGDQIVVRARTSGQVSRTAAAM
jgi:hypothetical protein